MEGVAEQPQIFFEWDKSLKVAEEAAQFAGRVIGSDPRYISHGEIQTGLSSDGESWADNLADLYARDFADLGEARELLVGRSSDRVIVAIMVVAWEETPRRRFAVVEDMAVEPSLRSHGIGERALDLVQARAADRGVDWLFLESGLANHGAHRFFNRNGFRAISQVFAKHVQHEPLGTHADADQSQRP
jgi:GNAT superfamily N-acetyltransferase